MMSLDCPDACDQDPGKRKKVGNYVLGPCLGEGTFAKVRVGTHTLSKAKVAVKIVSKRLMVRREGARRNFRREALLLQHVRHPNVVCLYEAMETPNSFYLVLELAARGSLLQYLASRKCLEEDEGRRFMRQIVSAVDHLHSSGIVHRDLKLENFLLSDEGEIKIVDFGHSATCPRDSGLTTQCGSPLYAAPEIFGNRRYGPPVDIWSIGVCLYALVVGRLPFLTDPPTSLPQLHALILKGAVIPNFLSANLQRLLSGLLEVQESRRLSINDVIDHSWLTSHRTQPIRRYPPMAQTSPLSIDTNLLRYMVAAFSFNESDVIHSVTERKLNASSATYHLLQHSLKSRDPKSEGLSNCPPSLDWSTGEDKYKDKRGLPSVKDGINFRKGSLGVHSTISRTSESQHLPTVVNANEVKSTTTESLLMSKGFEDKTALELSQNAVGDFVRTELPVITSKDVTKHYKECILFLKSVRSGMPLKRRSLSSLQGASPQDHRTEGNFHEAKVISVHRPDSDLSKLPVINSVRRPLSLQNPPQESNQALHPAYPSAAKSYVGVNFAAKGEQPSSRHLYLNPLQSQDFQLDVKGQAAWKEEDKTPMAGLKEGKREELGRFVGENQEHAVGRLPPAPPNSAAHREGPNHAYIPDVSKASLNSHVAEPGFNFITSLHVPSSVNAHSHAHHVNHIVLDPLGRYSWQNATAYKAPDNLRLASLSEAVGGRMSRPGVAYVAPLSSPKTLTNRDEVQEVKEKKEAYYLVTHLAADLNRKRSTVSSKKQRAKARVSLTAASRKSVSDDVSSGDVITLNHKHCEPEVTLSTESGTEKDSLFTPVIRVTIRSNAKH